VKSTIQSLTISVVFFSFLILALITAGCGGKSGMNSPQLYGAPSDRATVDSSKADDSGSIATGSNETSSSALGRHQYRSHRDDSQNPDEIPNLDDAANTSSADLSEAEDILSFGSTDMADSASAIDDEIWRKFELAEEYYHMGVMANREASWEEAQYYFEKGMKILAKLDIEADTTVSPEAVRYNQLLDNFVADYRSTLRSLGHLEPSVSASVVLERFSNMAENLGSDSIQVYEEENAKAPTYDLPVVLNDRVRKSIVYFQTVARDAFAKYLGRIDKYTPMMKRILRQYDLPEDLVYLSLVESGYNPHAYSWARAMGLWQFISSTGRLYKLDRNWWIDERKDPIKSTHAACQYLKYLYDEFGDWELAMAAYNGGPGRVKRTMAKQKTNDFWKLRLKRQTMDYVPLIYAAAIIAKDPEKYGFNGIISESEVVWDEVTIDRCLELKTVASEVGCSVEELQDLNPELLRKYTPPDVKNYKLKVPRGTTDQFYAAYDKMPSPQETSWVRHKISQGETVSHIAAKYGVSQYAIMEANNLNRHSRIYAGKTLIVPVPLDREFARQNYSNHSYEAEGSIYTVRSGDNLWDIARGFGTTVDALRGANYIQYGSRIYVGQKLKIPASAKNLKNRNSETSSGTYASSTPKSTTSSNTSSSVTKHKVRRGDTVWDIARQYGTTTANIRRLNNLSRSSRIYPGQILVVGGGTRDYVIHEVRRGETLSRIAQRYRVSMKRIISANDLADPDELTIGMQLKIYKD